MTLDIVDFNHLAINSKFQYNFLVVIPMLLAYEEVYASMVSSLRYKLLVGSVRSNATLLFLIILLRLLEVASSLVVHV